MGNFQVKINETKFVKEGNIKSYWLFEIETKEIDNKEQPKITKINRRFNPLAPFSLILY